MEYKNSSNSKKGFTLQEVLIVVALLALAVTFMLAFLNPFEQFKKARDKTRKSDLHNMEVAFEDYYNDKGCYPPADQVCYDSLDAQDNTCHICGSESGDTDTGISLPCDPAYPDKEYLYHPEESDCPQWYRIYTKLAREREDAQAEEVGCWYGLCGIHPDYGYSYGVSSPNVDLENPEIQIYCYYGVGGCSSCGDTVEECFESCESGMIYPSWDSCAADNF